MKFTFLQWNQVLLEPGHTSIDTLCLQLGDRLQAMMTQRRSCSGNYTRLQTIHKLAFWTKEA